MIKLGIDNINNYLDLFKGKRVGLITNPSGLNSENISSIDILNEKVNLVALFSPEHGVRGNIQAGMPMDAYKDEKTGANVYSLYGKTKKPTKDMLDNIDIMCIDIQDAGARFYTYIYTMAYAMMACKEMGKEFIVFDRPNPVNGVSFNGNVLNTAYRSFIGYYPILQRYGMTIGELARLFNEEYKIGCNLKIIKMSNYDRRKYYDELGLLWVLPSPNLPTLSSTITYLGTCIFEGTNISEGRGTTKPFEFIGAPFINGAALAARLNAYKMAGVFFRETYFTPTFAKYKDKLCGGVQVHILSRDIFEPVKMGWIMLDIIRKMYPNEFKVNAPYKAGMNNMLELNTGCGYIAENKYDLKEQLEILEKDTLEFSEIRKKYLEY